MAKRSSWSVVDDTRVRVDRIVGRPKKITGTRLGKVLNCNKWGTPFQAWCEITRVAELPFEGNKYTEAGKVIEPKLIEHCKDYITPDIVTPEDMFGENFFEKTYGNFFDDEIFGGMWDALYKDEYGSIAGVIECKTSSRPQDWVHGVPQHYAVQGLLYAHLLGVDDVYFAVAFLDPDDYDAPQNFTCDDSNTVLYHLTVTDDFLEDVDYAREWWYNHVRDGAVSPVFDAKKDAEFLDAMRTTEVSNVNDVDGIVNRLAEIDDAISRIRADTDMDALENEQKVLTDRLKTSMMESFDGTSDKVKHRGWTLSRSTRRSVDSKAMKADGVYDKYAKETVSYRLTHGKE